MEKIRPEPNELVCSQATGSCGLTVSSLQPAASCITDGMICPQCRIHSSWHGACMFMAGLLNGRGWGEKAEQFSCFHVLLLIVDSTLLFSCLFLYQKFLQNLRFRAQFFSKDMNSLNMPN